MFESNIVQSFENNVAKYRTNAGFAISEGWNCKGPITSQRFASFTVTPRGENLTRARDISTNIAKIPANGFSLL